MASAYVLASLVALSGPGGQVIGVNPDSIISIRQPRAGAMHHTIKCVVHTDDGKFISLVESCASVHHKLERAE